MQLKKPDLYTNDLPEDRFRHYMTCQVIAVDTETRGLNIRRDRLCLVQLCDEEGLASLIQIKQNKAVNLIRLLEAPSVIKLFHYARFDLAVLKHYLKANASPVWCTKIASRLVRTYTDRHSLKDLSKELLGLEMDKSDQSSDWAKEELSESQLEYAANDVRVLIPIYKKLKTLLEREGRQELSQKLFRFLPTMSELDLEGWSNIFEH